MKQKHIQGIMFCVFNSIEGIDLNAIVMLFKEEKATTIILKSWLNPKPRIYFCYGVDHAGSFLPEAVGLTAAFSVFSLRKISCNVVAAYYHDHIVDQKDSSKTMEILNRFSK
jgi:hypothetical protein